VHDYFDLLGLSSSAPASEIRRRSASRPRRWHPDFGGCGSSLIPPPPSPNPPRRDAALDFVNMTVVIGRMQQAFFENV
jgi:hypothetical protein